MTSLFAAHARAGTRCGALPIACVAALLLALAGCATTPAGAPGRRRRHAGARAAPAPTPAPPQPTAPPLPRNVEPPAPKSTCRAFRCRIARAMPTAARAPTGPERKDATRFSADMNYRTGWTDGRGAVQEARSERLARARRGEALARIRRPARPAPPRADVGRSRGAEAVPAARLDGRRRVVPVPGRCARARLARDRARSARVRPQRVAAAGLLVPRLHRRSRSAARLLRAGRERRSRAATASAATSSCTTPACGPQRVRRLVSLDGFGIPDDTPDAAARKIGEMARRAARADQSFKPYREPRRRGRSAAEEQSAAAARQGAVPRGALGRRRCRTAARS